MTVAGDAIVAEATEVVPPATRDRGVRTVAWSIGLGVVVLAGAVLAVMLHRNGHNQGDDFALYLRQARSIFDGDMSQVVADNRFSVLNSGGSFSPIAYPWGFPLLLAPFVHQWGLDYDRLKLVEVGCFCAWIVLAHGVVRRRLGRGVALAVAAVMATTPLLLMHTDQLLSEFPHAVVLGIWLWWLDRVLLKGPLIGASSRQLVTVGVLAAAAYNVRRESLVLVGVILVVQLVELVHARRGRPPVPVPWLTVATPYLAFFGSVIGFQLLMPSMLLPDAGDSKHYIPTRLADFTGVLSDQLGLGTHTWLGVGIVVLAAAGMVVACIKRPRLDVPLATLTVLSTVIVSTHFRMVGRYYFQIFPWILYFAAAAIVAAAQAVRRAQVRRVAVALAVVPLLFLVGVHLVELPHDISAARDFNAGGNQQVGPTDPAFTPIYAAVAKYTEPGAVIGFFRARTMTLLTDRRAIQTTSLPRMLQNANYYAQERFSDYYQPDLSESEGLQRGLVPVWENSRWILWRLPDHPPAATVLGGS